MFDTFDFMAFNWCCILGGPYYPTLPYRYSIWLHNTGDGDCSESRGMAETVLKNHICCYFNS